MSVFDQAEGNDLKLDERGRLVLLSDPVEAAAVKLANKLRSVKGEWFLDTRVGVPYFESIWGQKSPNLTLIAAIFRRVILSTEPIVDVEDVEISLDSERVLHYSFRAICEDGRVIVGGEGAPFIVEEGL